MRKHIVLGCGHSPKVIFKKHLQHALHNLHNHSHLIGRGAEKKNVGIMLTRGAGEGVHHKKKLSPLKFKY